MPTTPRFYEYRRFSTECSMCGYLNPLGKPGLCRNCKARYLAKRQAAETSVRQMARWRAEKLGEVERQRPAKPGPPMDEVSVAMRDARGSVVRAARVLGMSPEGLETRRAFEKYRNKG